MASKKTYSVHNTNQLIDLNGGLTNFQAGFKVKSQNAIPFELLVVDQETLDNNPNIEYKKVESGEISGEVVNDTGKFQDYFLILKSSTPCKCEVEINTVEVPERPRTEKSVPGPASGISQPVSQPLQNQTSSPSNQPEKQNVVEESTNWFKIFVILLVVGTGVYVLYRTMKKDNSEPVEQPGNSLLDRLKNLQD